MSSPALELWCHHLTKHKLDIEAYLEERWKNLKPLPYFSCDIRHSSHKISVVDTNLFPGGFNNLCNNYTKDTINALKKYFETYFPTVKNIALFAETHTRNKFYLFNILRLQQLLTTAGFNCKVTMPLEYFREPKITVNLGTEKSPALLEIHEPHSQDSTLRLSDFSADLILLNNDLSAGIPQILNTVDSQKIIPSLDLGWHRRRKSNYFVFLDKEIADFTHFFKMDPWIITPKTRVVSGVSQEHLEVLANAVDEFLKELEEEYKKREVTDPPYVFVKNDRGTYGLGVMSFFGAEEIKTLNHKEREKLFSSRSRSTQEQFIIQEGIPTSDIYSDTPIEPVIYGVGKNPIGGFFRIHPDKNKFESLNSPGMDFSCLCLHKLDEKHEEAFLNCSDKQHLVTVSFFLARLAALAAAKEAADITMSA